MSLFNITRFTSLLVVLFLSTVTDSLIVEPFLKSLNTPVQRAEQMSFAKTTWFTSPQDRAYWGTLSGLDNLKKFTQLIPNLDKVEIHNQELTLTTGNDIACGMRNKDNYDISPHATSYAYGKRNIIKVVEFNAERGKYWEEFRDMVLHANNKYFMRDADIIILNEMDIGMARTNNSHTTRLLADALGMHFAWGLEFLELTIGDATEQSAVGEDALNTLGLHGNAVLSRCPIEYGKLIRGTFEGDYYADQATPVNAKGYEKRLGARMMLLAKTTMWGYDVMVGAAHKVQVSAIPEIAHALSRYNHSSYVKARGMGDASGDVSSTVEQQQQRQRQQNAAVILAGDQSLKLCSALHIPAVDNPKHATWPASCMSPGRIRGDIICSNLVAASPEVTVLPCPTGRLISDHAIKVMELQLL
jgi:endonuclease/exonuclease/phosphatase family metal-dependent hydrolase